MPYEIHLKEDYGNRISDILKIPIKKISVPTLTISNGLLQKNNYYIPLDNILFIKEV